MSIHPRSRISACFATITPSTTLTVDAKAKALKAQGHPIIGFGTSGSDFPTPEPIVEAAVRAARESAIHHYTPTAGLPELRSAVAEKALRGSGYEVDPTQILVTNGGKQAIFQAFASILDLGSETLLPTPYWTTYPRVIRPAGGVTIPVLAGAEQDYKVSVEQLEAARTGRTKIFLHCSPSSPMGSVYTPTEAKAIDEWALEHDIWVVTDEIYEHLLYEDTEPARIVKLVPELADQSLVLNEVVRTYAVTGWRVGWMIGPGDVVKAATSFQPHLTSNISNIAQRATPEAISGPLNAVYEMRKAFNRRRRTMISMLSEIEGMTVPTPKGTFCAYPSVGGTLGKHTRGTVPTSSTELASLTLDEVETALVPGEVFGPSGFLRLSYAPSDDGLVEGVGRVQSLPAEAR